MNILDIELFILLKLQAIDVFWLLVDMREFALGKGLQNDVQRLDCYIENNMQMIKIATDQISELEQTHSIHRIGFFDTLKTL